MTPDRPLIIYGTGGHGRVVAEAAQAAGWRIAAFADDQADRSYQTQYPILNPNTLASKHSSNPIIVAIGDNKAREKICNTLRLQGLELALVIHPSAWVSPSAQLKPGTFVGPHAVINAAAHVDAGAIINSAAVIEHDCRVGPFAHVAPRAVLGARVTIGDRALIATAAAVRPDVAIGQDCVLGVGAVAVKNIPAGQTALGVPAKPVRSRPDSESPADQKNH